MPGSKANIFGKHGSGALESLDISSVFDYPGKFLSKRLFVILMPQRHVLIVVHITKNACLHLSKYD